MAAEEGNSTWGSFVKGFDTFISETFPSDQSQPQQQQQQPEQQQPEQQQQQQQQGEEGEDVWSNLTKQTNEMAAGISAAGSSFAKEVNEAFDRVVSEVNTTPEEENNENNENNNNTPKEENKEGVKNEEQQQQQQEEEEEEEEQGISETVGEIGGQVAGFFVGAGEVVGEAVNKLVDDAGEAWEGMGGEKKVEEMEEHPELHVKPEKVENPEDLL